MKRKIIVLRDSFSSAIFWLLFILTVLTTGCISSETKREHPTATKKFKAKKETAWEALLVVFKKYPKKNINEEAGLIETETIRAGKIWSPVGVEKQRTSGISYTLRATLVQESPYIYATIKKILKSQRDFFSKPEIVESDLLEEQTLLYRLKREIEIKKLIKKLYR